MAYGPSARGGSVAAAALPSDPIRMIMRSPVATADTGDTLRECAEQLASDEIGALLVLGEGAVGILSERDIIAAVAGGDDLDRIQAEDALNPEVVWADPQMSIERAGRLMLDSGIRHLPIGDGRLAVGMVSMRDVVAVLLGG
jgi:CBS domain-containing protein